MRGPVRAPFLAVLLLAAVAMPALAGGKRETPVAPGKYTDWGGEIDELEVVQGFKVADYPKIVVAPFDVKDVELPPKDENTYEPVQEILKDPARPFVEGLSEELAGVPVTEGAEAEGPALLLRVKILTMDPGSRAKRYWASFGAGAARTELSGEAVDAATGKTLFRFKQERRSGWGLTGGDYVKLMAKNLRTLGKDVAFVLKRF